MRKQKKYHYIYKTTNPKGRYYIGMHSTDNLEDGYMGSGKRLKYSLNKHGKEAHHFEILEYLLDRDSLKEREAEIINEELLLDPLCMNLCKGGNEGWGFINDDPIKKKETQAKAAKAGGIANAIKNKDNPEYRRKLSQGQKNNWERNPDGYIPSFLGLKHTEKTINLMQISSRGVGIGKENSQYDTCWVYKNREKKIKKDELDLYLSEGWHRGRK